MTENNGLPTGWQKTTIGEIVSFEYGKGLRKDRRDETGEFPVYGSNGIVGYHTEALVDSPCLVVGRKGTAGAVHLSKVPCWPIDTTYYVVPPEGVRLGFFYHLLSSLQLEKLDKSTAIHFVRYANRNVSGVQHPRVSPTTLAEFEVELPPRPEQERIVARIEETFTQLEAGVAELKNAKAQLKRYRAAVLKSAVEGELTREWREAHQGQIEPAEKLLALILEERRKKWEEEGGKGKYKEPAAPDMDDLPELPDGWIWAKLEQLTDMSSGKAFKKKEYTEQGARLLQIANVTFGEIIWDQQNFLPESYFESHKNLKLNAGDLLMALNRPILGGRLKIGELKEMDAPAILYQRVGRFDFYDTVVKSYFYWFLQSPFFISRLRKSLQGVDQPFVNKPRLLNFPISLPPIDEQRQIVAKVERRLSVADEIEKELDGALVRAERLRGSVLKSAFEGRLV